MVVVTAQGSSLSPKGSWKGFDGSWEGLGDSWEGFKGSPLKLQRALEEGGTLGVNEIGLKLKMVQSETQMG